MRVPDPAFYKRPSSSVNIDLGSLAKLGAIEDRAKAVDDKAVGIANQIDRQSLVLKQEIGVAVDKSHADVHELRTAVLERISIGNTTATGEVKAAISEAGEAVMNRVTKEAKDLAADISEVATHVKEIRKLVQALEEDEDEVGEHNVFIDDNVKIAADVTQLQWSLLSDSKPEEFNALRESVEANLWDRADLTDLLPERWTTPPDLHVRSAAYWKLQALIEHLADDDDEDADDSDVLAQQAAAVSSQFVANQERGVAKPTKKQAKHKAKLAAAE